MGKAFREFGSVLEEFKWLVSLWGPWCNHFGAAALDNATNVMAFQDALLEIVRSEDLVDSRN
jgi:hypothetical protein